MQTDDTEEFPTEFASSHFTVLHKLRQRVLTIADNPDASMAEVNKAITIEIKIANYLHKVKERKERAENPKRTPPPEPTDQGSARCPTALPSETNPTPEPAAQGNEPCPNSPPPPATPAPEPSPAPATPPEPQCWTRTHGYSCPVMCAKCVGGLCTG